MRIRVGKTVIFKDEIPSYHDDSILSYNFHRAKMGRMCRAGAKSVHAGLGVSQAQLWIQPGFFVCCNKALFLDAEVEFWYSFHESQKMSFLLTFPTIKTCKNHFCLTGRRLCLAYGSQFADPQVRACQNLYLIAASITFNEILKLFPYPYNNNNKITLLHIKSEIDGLFKLLTQNLAYIMWLKMAFDIVITLFILHSS